MSDETNREQLQAEAHLKNLEALVTARTEQLRQAVTQKHELLESIRHLQSQETLEPIKRGLQSIIEKFADPPVQVPKFGGEPGEPVPEVDPEDLKASWEFCEKLQSEHPGEQIAVAMGVGESICKPGADIQAVGYRSTIIWLTTRIAPEKIAPFLQDGKPTNAVFHAAAKVPLEWMGVGIVRQGPPFDPDEFLRLCKERS